MPCSLLLITPPNLQRRALSLFHVTGIAALDILLISGAQDLTEAAAPQLLIERDHYHNSVKLIFPKCFPR